MVSHPMSSDPSALAGTWAFTIQAPDGNQYPMSVNIQVSSDGIRVVMQSPQGSVEADNVAYFADGVLHYSLPTGGVSVPFRVTMRQDGNIDVVVDYQGMLLASVGTKSG